MWHTFCRTLLAGTLAAALVHGPAHASQAIPVEELARLPALQSVSMSPDGKHLVALIPSPRNPDETALALWNTDALSSGPKVVTPSGDHMKFIAAAALKAGKILAVARQEWTGELGGCGEGKVTGATRTFMTKAYLTDDDQKTFDEAFASNTRKLGISQQTQTCLELSGTASLVNMLPLDPDKVIIRQLNELSLTSSYFLYNLKTKDTELLFRGGARATPALFDSRTGKVLAKTEVVPVDGDYEQRVQLLNGKSGQFEPQAPLTTRLSDRHTVDIAGIDDATGKYYVLTDQFSDKVQARLYDPTQHKYDPEPVVADKDYSIGALLFSTRRSNFNQVVGFVVDGPYRQTIYVDPTLKAIQDGIKNAFPGQQVAISDYTDDFSTVLFSTGSASTPTAYHLLHDRKVVSLGSTRPWLAKGLTGDERWVSYTARDGLEIPAILDLPAGWKKGDAPAPAVVMPHGGPWARDYLGWDVSGWVPLLTSRGYAVLRPQYRGSEGLGRRLWLAGDKQWGLKMSDDNDDGAAWLIAQGIADKDRIAIFGYSYGGFAAIAADVRSPSPFKCAIAGAPVANLGRLGTSWSDNRLQRILQGQTVKGMDPMQNTAKAHLPIMLFGGDRDVRVPPFHPRDFYKAVKDIVPAQYHVIADMPHSMPWYPRQQRETLELIANYLDKDCGLARH
ncbi:prolyl oligopeptidase family serine peptidase [Fulvimonas sp. R45]|uniref:prolyl oligopeptidase family serine peptidase n=1 Tax=Fulvimonas sp. R45 TaxID=3045937 RepID=UPI00265DB92B|nr:prolyl oligopeptidase family serine peptidase [Fulvimonas sp. R45]MDO1528485.1 prolyl oligopeptidase family serine peptidase [Fulvimonas sp. R45]